MRVEIRNTKIGVDMVDEEVDGQFWRSLGESVGNHFMGSDESYSNVVVFDFLMQAFGFEVDMTCFRIGVEFLDFVVETLFVNEVIV